MLTKTKKTKNTKQNKLMLFKFKQKLLIIVIRVIQFICRMHTNNTGILVANIKQTQQMQ